MTTFDLSVTKNPEWIKEREELWKPIGESLKEGLRKKDVDKVHHYFMTGMLRDGEEMSDSAKFYWFPVQTPEAWDHIFANMFNSTDAEKEFESIFYFQLGDLSGRALTAAQELGMWDYFVGNSFQSTVSSRVPVGREKNIVTFNVDRKIVSSKVCGRIDSWLEGSHKVDAKWIQRQSYFFSFIDSLTDEDFELNKNGRIIGSGLMVKYLMKSVVGFEFDNNLKDGNLSVRQEFAKKLYIYFDAMSMPQTMKCLWEEIKTELSL
jgi:hypothetical protein